VNTEIVGCSLDPQEENRCFAEENGFEFPLLSDQDKRISLAYGAIRSRRDSFAQRIAYLVGTDGRVLEAHSSVNPRTYPYHQLERIRSSQIRDL
jgi:peroxiredoxin Q/BCP